VPSLRDIRKRIRSVKSTQQITKAMKMVAAAKLRRAQEAILKARPYALLLQKAIAEVAARAAAEGGVANPLLVGRESPKRAELVLVTSDRGLAGAFNSNILRRGQRFLTENQEKYEQAYVTTIGRKARDFCRVRKIQVRKDYAGVHQQLSFAKAEEIAEEMAQRYLSGEVDQVFFCYNEFKSAISQKLTVQQLLPVEAAPAGAEAGSAIDFKYEPNREQMLAELLPRHLAIQVWRVLLESAASEHGARMTAMDSASRNARDLISKLTLQYNRARQAYITKELMEIVSGAEALK
jgi:F-type H+-transporting ATPase subunit gamma